MKKKKVINYLILFIPIIILMGISLINMKMVGKTNLTYKSYFLKQALWFLLGFFILFILVLIKPKKIFKYSKLLYLGNVLLSLFFFSTE